jgi:hypothetical protein
VPTALALAIIESVRMAFFGTLEGLDGVFFKEVFLWMIAVRLDDCGQAFAVTTGWGLGSEANMAAGMYLVKGLSDRLL